MLMTERPAWSTFHSHNPYAGFPHDDYPLDVQGWNFLDPIFQAHIEAVKPAVIIEVGTWKGGSAIRMADICKSLGLKTTILCIDTWLGSLEFWHKDSDPGRYNMLNSKFGYPQVYYQFMANVIKSGHQDVIVPLPMTSLIGARLLAMRSVRADLIYIDASHDYPDVRDDLNAYATLLQPHGIMFGDDYCDWWPGVVQAVQEFAAQKRIPVAVERNFWTISPALVPN